MGPIYVELTPVTGDKESIIINFMDIDDIIAAHGNEFEFKGRVNHYDNLEYYNHYRRETYTCSSVICRGYKKNTR